MPPLDLPLPMVQVSLYMLVYDSILACSAHLYTSYMYCYLYKTAIKLTFVCITKFDVTPIIPEASCEAATDIVCTGLVLLHLGWC